MWTDSCRVRAHADLPDVALAETVRARADDLVRAVREAPLYAAERAGRDGFAVADRATPSG